MRTRQPLSMKTRLMWVAVLAFLWICVCGCHLFGDREAMARRQADAIAQLNQMQSQIHAMEQQRQADSDRFRQQLREDAAGIAAQQIEAWGQSQAVDVGQLTQEIAETIATRQREQIAPEVQRQVEAFATANGIDAAEVLDGLRAVQTSIEQRDRENEQKLAEQDAAIADYRKAIEDTRASIPDEQQRTSEVRDAVVSALTGLLMTYGPWGAGAAAILTAGRTAWKRRRDGSGQGGPADAPPTSPPPTPPAA